MLAVALVGGCGGQDETPAPPPPTSVREADPCSFVAKSVITESGLKRVSDNKSETSRSCSWTSAKFSAMVLVRWDASTLVDFGQAFPVPAGENMDLDGVSAVVATSNVRPACAAVFPAQQGTIVEIVAGDEPPSTTDSACARVRTIGTSAVQEIRKQHLLDEAPSTEPTPT